MNNLLDRHGHKFVSCIMDFQPLIIIIGVLFAAVGGAMIYFLVRKAKEKK